MTINKEQDKRKIRYINDPKVLGHQKPLSPTLEKDIQSAEKLDQSYAIMKYRELLAARKKKLNLRPREPEIYHLDFFKR